MPGLIHRSIRLASQALVVLSLACSGGDDDGGVTVPPPPATGSLTVTVTGLPTGTNGTVTVTGPSGFTRSLTATETLSSLTPGAYTVTAANVTASDGRYAATPPSQNITVAGSSTPAAATVTYALATGSLTVTISGLPTGTNATVTVTGPAQFTRAITGTTTIDVLEPGTYNVTAFEVNTTNDSYSVNVPNVQVVVTAGSAPSVAVVTYALATGRLTVNVAGLPAAFGKAAPAAVNGAVTVNGPNGFTRLITATTLLTLLKPGLYSVTAANVIHGSLTYRATPVSSAVTVVASTTPATASLTYGPIDGALTVTVSGLPQGANAAITVTGPNGFNQTPTATTTYAALPPGAYTIDAVNVMSSATFTPIPTSQNVEVTIGAVTTATVAYTAPVLLALGAVASGLDRPVHLTSPPADARLFVVEQTGKIRIISNGTLISQPFLDVSARILAVTDPDDEHGLLGLVFHPSFATNGFFFIYYMDPAQDLVLERYQVSANPNVAGTAGTVVLRIPHTFKKSHNGGGLTFGPDGYLYVSVGDGGCCYDPQGNAQNLNTLLGKVLRIDVSLLPYAIPASNPFVGQAGRRGEIWAYGLRNPWRFDIDVPTSTLYIADVGEDDFEEVDAVPTSIAGPNFGWSLAEGPLCLQPGCNGASLRAPVVSFPHSEGCAITGGFVYRGQLIPEVQGQYFYSDYCSGFLRSFVLINGTAVQQKDWNIASPGFVTSFGRDASGELYVLVQSGTVYKIVKQ